ncbi:phage capsid protein [Roseburia sp. AM23-20]|uniref:phage minor capsid protein n=1 Tax=Roseburia sp. AM23-20 TaxID=2292066 RepID=UPI000E4D0F64|nr:phage minor capsid protein [Roseburia sp. AM23-20]RHF89412.1 phage capsid protein [Roseburia sp. AM23-20]
MLTPDYFYGKSDKLIEMYQELEDWIISDIAMRLIKSGEMSGTTDRELWKLQQMGLHHTEIVKRISQMTGKSRDEVRRLLRDSVMTSFSDDAEVLKRLGDIQTPLQNNAAIMAMNAEMMKTFGELNNLTRTTMLQTQRDLLNMLNEVDYRVASGMQSYNSAICEVLDRYAQSGVVIDYPTGARRSLEAAVRCCVVTSMNQTAAQVTNQYIVQKGIEYVLVSAHMGARHSKKFPDGIPSHDHWQGKVYKIVGSDKDTPNLLDATGYTIDPKTGQGRVVDPLGLHGYNCRHSHKPWDKSLRNPYVDADGNPKINVHESQELYEKQQQQRSMERAIRQTKRELLAKQAELSDIAETDVKDMLQPQYDKLAYKLRIQNQQYKQFCADNGLQTQADRIKVAGFKEKQSAVANGRATAYSNSVKVPMEKAKNVGYTKRTREEFEQTAQQIKNEITQYSDRPSKWSGNIIVDNLMMSGGTLGAKEWSCDISLIDTVDDGTIWHEMLHSCSCSYYRHEVYDANEYIEETSVEWLKQQICKEKNIANSYAYEDKTIVLQSLNDSFLFGTDMEFAKELYNVPLPERYQWLKNRVDEYLKRAGASNKDYEDVMNFVERLKGGSNGRH